MTHPTYHVNTILDLLRVPADRRETCVRELLYGLAMHELLLGGLAEGDLIEHNGFEWTDDGDLSITMAIGDDEYTLQAVPQEGDGA